MRVSVLRVVVLAGFAASIGSHAAAADFFQGFETDNSGWFNASRVSSGTGGITAATGDYFGQVGVGDFTRWGGYSESFASIGYTTAVDVYLDMDGGWANDTRFDYSSAINNSAGTHLRDFIFTGGFYNDAGGYGSGNRFVFSASNNSPGWPRNPARDPFAVTTTGWYTLEHNFGIVGGVLSVDMTLRMGGSALHSWTLSNSGDLAANVGGNRYGWFVTNGFGTLAIDNSRRTGGAPVPEPFTMGLGIGALALGLRRRLKAASA